MSDPDVIYPEEKPDWKDAPEDAVALRTAYYWQSVPGSMGEQCGEVIELRPGTEPHSSLLTYDDLIEKLDSLYGRGWVKIDKELRVYAYCERHYLYSKYGWYQIGIIQYVGFLHGKAAYKFKSLIPLDSIIFSTF